MRTVVAVPVMVLTLLVGLLGSSSALTLHHPVLSFDSSQGPGANTFTGENGGGVFFDNSTGLLTVSAQALSINWGAGSIPLIGGTVDYQVMLLSASVGGPLVIATFGPVPGDAGSSPGDTEAPAGDADPTGDAENPTDAPADGLIVADGTGILLTGQFISYTLYGLMGGDEGFAEALFTVTGGALASAFGDAGGIVSFAFNVDPGFDEDTFTMNWDFSGDISGDLGRVPEPSSLLLLCCGFAGLGALGWRRRRG